MEVHASTVPPMTSRERIQAALRHRPVDRVPRDLGGTIATGINIVAYRNLVAHLGLAETPVMLSERARLADISEPVLQRFGSDARGLVPGASFTVGKADANGAFTDGFGVVRRLPDEQGHYYVVHAPLDGEITTAEVAAAASCWPDPYDPAILGDLETRAQRWHEETDYAVVLNLPIGSIHTAQWVRGMEAWLTDLVADPTLSVYLLDTLLARWLATCELLIGRLGRYIDVLFFAEDVAFHTGPMVSPRTYRRIIQPYQRRVFEALRTWSSAPIVYHNCGSVAWQIEDLIEMGVAALNPLQVNAAGMGDTAALKRKFGDRMAFWGGVDTSYVLPRGTPVEVVAEARRRIADLNVNGGYVLASVHNIQADVPAENLCAMWEVEG